MRLPPSLKVKFASPNLVAERNEFGRGIVAGFERFLSRKLQVTVCITPQQPPYVLSVDSATSRQQAFLAWVEQSPEHVRVCFETMEVEQLVLHMDPHRHVHIRALLDVRLATVTPLYEPGNGTQTRQQARKTFTGRTRGRRRRIVWGLAATVAALSAIAFLSFDLFGSHTYVTSIGEQRTVKLEDGSFVFLNTDSRVEVRFSDRGRHIELIQGEALFNVSHDSTRPFTVNTGGTSIRAVGTQFNVRRLDEETDVAVVEGIVQIAGIDRPALPPSSETGKRTDGEGQITRLAAGEEARIVSGRVSTQKNGSLDDALAWRKRRLIFTDAPLGKVAAEFNRYNRTKIRVEGDTATGKQLTGIFDADRPQAVIGYAMRDESLSVEPDGRNWVIRAR
jgi:transmembrane sensor